MSVGKPDFPFFLKVLLITPHCTTGKGQLREQETGGAILGQNQSQPPMTSCVSQERTDSADTQDVREAHQLEHTVGQHGLCWSTDNSSSRNRTLLCFQGLLAVRSD